MDNMEKILARYQNELYDNVLPFWMEHAIDHEYGGFLTCLERDGSVYDTSKFMWMQWRIVYMLAKIYDASNGKGDARWIEVAQQGYDFLTQHGKSEDGTYYFALNRKGEPAVAPYNIYTDYYAGMAAAALAKVTGDDNQKAEAEFCTRSFIRRMNNPKGRWEKSLPGKKQRRFMEFQMMPINLFYEVEACTGTTEYHALADEMIRNVFDIFWNKDMRLLFQYVDVDGAFDFDSFDGRRICPGNFFESMYFFLVYADHQKRTDIIAPACEIIRGGFDFGWDRDYGGFFNYLDALHKPHVELQWDMKLWWGHCEALNACMSAYRSTRDPYFLDRFLQVDDYVWTHFKDPEYPEWFGYLNRRGEVTHTLKGGKWKTFFHLPRMLLHCITQMEQILGKPKDQFLV